MLRCAQHDAFGAFRGPVFVSNERSGSITVIDSGSGKVIKNIAVGMRVGTEPEGVAVRHDGK